MGLIGLVSLISLIVQLTVATAMAQAVDARVASVKGAALRRSGQRVFILARGDALKPGDEIDTRGGGRVVIELTDGSAVIVHPNSRVVMSEYRAAAGLRELCRIIIGRVRVKIAHYGGKPNPYRVNSPTASILVRGTEFSVAVEPSGDTRVEVYEGLVEVASLSDPRYRALLSPGRGAVVRPNEEIRLFTPGGRLNERGDGKNDRKNGDGDAADDGDGDAKRDEAETDAKAEGKKLSARNPGDDAPGRNGAAAKASLAAQGRGIELAERLSGADVADNAGLSVRARLANGYEGYVAGVAGRGWALPLQRFIAFADSHFDSLDNPAYATEFASIEGRLWLVPGFNKASGGDLQGGSAALPFPGGDPMGAFDQALLARADFFIPLERARAVIGGAVTVSRDRSQSIVVDKAPAFLTRLFPRADKLLRYAGGSTETASITGSLMAARRFGDGGRTSLGVGVEWASIDGALRGQTALASDAIAIAGEKLEAGSQIDRRLFRIGMAQELDGGHKLGLLYSHDLTTADDRDRLRLSALGPLSPDSTRQEERSSEVSARLRGPFTRRLFYGVEASFLWGESDERIERAFITDSTADAEFNRVSADFGLGFALRRTTLLSADFAFGLSRIASERREDQTGNPVEERRERERFASGRLGLQTDLWRRSFASFSALAVWEAITTDLNLYPDIFGRRLTSFGLAESDGRSRQSAANAFLDFGAGWRFNRNLLAEYVLSISPHLGPPRHIFLLRYTFRRER